MHTRAKFETHERHLRKALPEKLSLHPHMAHAHGPYELAHPPANGRLRAPTAAVGELREQSHMRIAWLRFAPAAGENFKRA
jgi:hypothetical protein